jgi:hypothetical protein
LKQAAQDTLTHINARARCLLEIVSFLQPVKARYVNPIGASEVNRKSDSIDANGEERFAVISAIPSALSEFRAANSPRLPKQQKRLPRS